MRFLLHILFLLLPLIGISQSQYQRMLIPNQNITLTASGINSSASVLGKCIDPFAKIPESSTNLANVLQNSQNAIVEFTDEDLPSSIPLKEIIGKQNGIIIKGDENGTLINSLLSDEIKIYLEFKNKTNRPLRIKIENDIVLGEKDDPLSKTYRDKPQSELWKDKYNEYSKDLNELGFDTDDVSRNVQDFKESYFQKKEPTEQEFENKIIELKNVKSNRKKVLDAFRKYDIGVKETTVDNLITEFNKATRKNCSPQNIVKELSKEFNEGNYYLYSSATDNYIPFIRSKRIEGMLFKKTDYVNKYHQRIEDNLFRREINESNFEILNFLDKSEDERTYNLLKELFPNNSSDFTFQSLTEFKSKLKERNIEFLFCFGHYENGAIFTFAGKEKIKHSYDIDFLQKLASELDIKLFFIGCKSSIATQGGTGTTINVNSLEVLQDLFQSLNNANNLGEFLSNLGKRNRGTYTYEFDENTGIIRVRIYDNDGEYHHSETSQVILESNLFDLFNIIRNSPTAIQSLTKIIEDEKQSTEN